MASWMSYFKSHNLAIKLFLVAIKSKLPGLLALTGFVGLQQKANWFS